MIELVGTVLDMRVSLHKVGHCVGISKSYLQNRQVNFPNHWADKNKEYIFILPKIYDFSN